VPSRYQKGTLRTLTSGSLLCTFGWFCLSHGIKASGLDPNLDEQIRQRAAALESKLITGRRDIHEHPELGDKEFRTAKLVADHLRSLGLEVTTGVARTGVVALMRGSKPGPVVALRADMDALPVKEAVDLPFASKAKGTYVGAPSDSMDLMHACGHDAHTAILMAVAEVLTGIKDQLPGTVKFVFQPAEEGPSDFLPNGKNVWGAKLMIQEGVLTNPKPDAIFGLHVTSILPAATIGYRPGAAMASSDELRIKVIGRGTHAARPWAGIDPIVVAAEI
jgi:amidohydrolase